MRLLFIGDIVGTPGVSLVRAAVPWLRQREQLTGVIANAENASGGSGLTPALYRQLRACGIDAITMGDHIYKRYELADTLRDPAEPIVKPANYPPDAPGKTFTIITLAGLAVAVVSLMGRTYMRPVDCPFLAIDRVLKELPTEVKMIVVDLHAEATADKYQLGYYLAGRVSAVLGTHTHVPTADEQILPGGTAFICDVGMTGPHDSVIGRRKDRIIDAAKNFVPSAFDVATDDVRLNGVILELDPLSGKAESIRRIVVRETDLPPAPPVRR